MVRKTLYAIAGFALVSLALVAVAFEYVLAPLRSAFVEAFPVDVAPSLGREVHDAEVVDFATARARQRSFADRLIARTDLGRRPSLAIAA